MVAKRRLSLFEVIVATALLMVFLPVLLPSPRTEAGALRERLERAQARLIVEGELDRAGLDARAGRLRAMRDEQALRPDGYASGGELRELRLSRSARAVGGPDGAGLLEVRVRATWRSAAVTAPDQELACELTTWVEGRP
ncbi:MAG: hypothetical protein AB7N76_13770 [Planctomycetota bacterium]